MDVYWAFKDVVINAVAICTAIVICIALIMIIVNAFSD